MIRKVAADLVSYLTGDAGIYTYSAHLFPYLLRAAPDVEFTFFATADHARRLALSPLGEAENANYKALPRRHFTERLAFFTFGGRPVENDLGPHDVYHSPKIAGFATRGAYVVTVHDLAWMYYKHIYTTSRTWAWRIGLNRDLKRARLILSGSEATKRDLVELKGVSPDRIRVVHHGTSAKFVPDRDPEAVGKTLSRLGIRTPYVLTLAGTHGPRKNLARLVRAMSRVRRRLGELQLVVLGRPVYDTTAYTRAITEEGLAEAVVRPGHLSESDLLDVLSGARVMGFPSLYEGFGFPILEAMASGTPVVTSNVSSMPEVAGDAAILVDPTDEEMIASGIIRVVEDDQLFEELRRKGLKRAATFTWERAAAQVLDVYREAVT